MAKKISTPAPFLKGFKHLSAEQLLACQDQSALHHLWRAWFVTQRSSQAGFILPTVTLLLLMVSLVIGLLISRTYSRTTQVIGDRQQTTLYNAVTPAVDRAKSKIEYLFSQAGLPPLPSDTDIATELAKPAYDLPAQANAGKETRIDINGDNTPDNAWMYTADLDGDGTSESIAYSILTNATATVNSVTYTLDSPSTNNKAQARVVRNGPINLRSSGNTSCANLQNSPYAGWESVNSSELRKAIQVHAVSLNNTNTTSSVSATVEMQQDRVANLGNRWGAWFRYDLELNPSARFNFNGALHTEGNFIWANTGTAPVLHLVSSPASCVYSRSASEISMADITNYSSTIDPDADGFQGQVFIGSMERDTQWPSNSSSVAVLVDRFVPGPSGPTIPTNSPDNTAGSDRVEIQAVLTTPTNTRIRDSVASSTKDQPSEVALDPVILQTLGISQARADDESNRNNRASTEWIEGTTPAVGNNDGGRIFNASTPVPFADDTFRADNRIGPGVGYGRASTGTFCGKTYCVGSTSFGGIGTLGTLTSTSDLVQLDPMANINALDEESYGLDGYWERRARRTGVRVIVGQRLELGNLDKWSTSDPLYPPQADAYSGSNMADRAHEMRQWKTLRDNLASVQSAAVYHYKSNNGNYPVACLALTAHPGTQVTDTRSRNINTATVNETLIKADVNGDGDQADTAVTVALHDFYGILTDEDVDRDGVIDNAGTATSEDLNRNGRLDAPGQGTNGFEFAPPFAGNATTFAAQIDEQFDGDTTYTALGAALTNLAYFAGDPAGAFPPQQDSAAASATNAAKTQANFATADAVGVVHPYPELTMWGNFSELRRVIGRMQGGTTYSQLSIADQSTLHTATCTLGMLAYSSNAAQMNQFLRASQLTFTTALANNIQSFGSEAAAMIDGNASNGEITTVYENLAGTGGDLDWDRNGTIDGTEYKGSSGDIAKAELVTFTQNETTLNVDLNGDGDKLDTSPYATFEDFYQDLLDPVSSYWTRRGITFSAAERTQFAQKLYGAAMAASAGGGNYKNDPTAVLNDLSKVAEYISLISLFQLDRDRQFGFVAGVYGNQFAPSSYNGGDWWSASNPQAPYGTGANKFYVGTGCDPYLFIGGDKVSPSPLESVPVTGGEVGETADLTVNGNDGGIALALSVCKTLESANSLPKFPALYYLFPLTAHQHDGTKKTGVTGGSQVLQNTADSYVTATATPYIFDRANSRGVNRGLNFEVVEDTGSIGDGDGVKETGESLSEFVNYLGVTPRTSASTWATPITTTSTGRANTITIDGTPHYPAFLDVGMYNGRELMSVRSLNIDLDLLRRFRFERDTGVATAGCVYADPTGTEKTLDNNGECWLPLPTLLENSGGKTTSGAIIYAFREDAVREDAIARPTRADASNLTCDTDTTVGTKDDDRWIQAWGTYTNTTNTSTSNGSAAWGDAYETNTANTLDPSDLVMNAVGNTGPNGLDPGGQYYDPPVNPCTGISAKPVDFYADPDRRPHGFTLRNGSDLRRLNGTTPEEDGRGMTFVSDNPVYVQGHFNLHSTDGTTGTANANLVEEFVTKLTANWSNFYSRTDLNPDFADARDVDNDNVIDSWRPTEIIADGVTILSETFTPGYIIDGLLWSTDASSAQNSYGGIPILRTNRRPGSSQNDAQQADATGTNALGRLRWSLENGKAISQELVTTSYPSSFDNNPSVPSINKITSPIELDRNGFPLYYAGETISSSSSYGTLTAYGTRSPTSLSPSTEHFEALNYDGRGDDSNNSATPAVPVVNTSDADGTQTPANTRQGRIQQPSTTTIFNAFNALVISGTNPNRAVHTSGGLPGMLRSIENWNTTLQFAGSIIQLNFNAYAGPFHQGAWEPGTMALAPSGSGGFSYFSYFSNPDRNWGFDPGLLYAPASPAARRLAVPSNTRSEFYRELSTNDPYIINLRCAYYDDDGDGIQKVSDPRVDSKISSGLCPN